MLRFGAAPIIVLVNNQGYSIEVEIHDGPYNRVQVWWVGFFCWALLWVGHAPPPPHPTKKQHTPEN